MTDWPLSYRAAGPVEAALRAAVGMPGLEIEAGLAKGEFRVVDTSPTVREAFERLPEIESTEVVGPFLYVQPTTAALRRLVVEEIATAGRRYGWAQQRRRPSVIVSIGCPNANKPLHIGHLRNCFFGMAISRLLEAAGHDVHRTEELSNYGIHIARALAAHLAQGAPEVPPNVKADHFVGGFYTAFYADEPELEPEARLLLLRMEDGDAEALAENERLTEWAIDGIRRTYTRIGTQHDFVLRELEALPVALQAIDRGLRHGSVLRRPDGSVYVDLDDVGLGEVTLLRQDGSPVAITQFVAIWLRRATLHPNDMVIRVTGEQWTLSFSRFLEVLRRLGHCDVAARTEAVYYGMIRQPTGAIRSRNGTDLTADGLLDRMRDRLVADWGQSGEAGQPYHVETCERLALAVVKLHILSRKRLGEFEFDEDDLDRVAVPKIASLARAIAVADDDSEDTESDTGPEDRLLLLELNQFPRRVARSLERRDPADLCGHLLTVAQRVERARAAGGLPLAVRRAAATVLGNGLWMLDVRLPSSLRELPPSLV